MCRRYMPDMVRTFCDDEDIRQTLHDHAGDFSRDLYNALQSPAHRADLFRYVYLYEHGGLYLDIKCSLRMQFEELRSCLAEEWGTAQSYAHSALGHCPTQPGQLPHDYMLMAIGNRGDHIFQGIIYCRPRHPLLLEAIIQFYSPAVLKGAAANDYLLFCKFLYGALRENLGHPPQHGWNISSRFGPIYLLRERHSKDLQAHSEIPTDGHYMITRLNKIAMFTRCWNWKRGFAGDLAAKARNEAQMLRATPDAASDAAWARSQAASPTSSTSGGDAPTNAELQMWADEAIAGNLYEKIMDALSQTKYYQDLNGNDVLDLIPKKLCLSEDQPGYLSCRHCLNKKSRRNVTFPTSVGVVNHFRRGSYHTPNSFLTDQLSSAAAASTTASPGPCPAPPLAPGHLVAATAEAVAATVQQCSGTVRHPLQSGQAWRRASWKGLGLRPPSRGPQVCISPPFWRPPRLPRWFSNLPPAPGHGCLATPSSLYTWAAGENVPSERHEWSSTAKTIPASQSSTGIG